MITTYTLTYSGIERDTPLKVKILSVLNGSIYITPALTDLQEDTRYVISVRANTTVGAGPWTNLTVHTPEDGEFLIFSSTIEVICLYIKFLSYLSAVLSTVSKAQFLIFYFLYISRLTF